MTTAIETHVLSPEQDQKSCSEQTQQQHVKEEEVQVDLTNMVGRIKPKPVCVDAILKQQAMSPEEISKFIFVVEEAESESVLSINGSIQTGKASDAGLQELSVVSSSSSTASRESGLSVSDTIPGVVNQSNNKQVITSIMSSSADGGFLHRKDESERINLKVKTQTISRNGRQTQRWYTDPVSNILYRRTTGCIPVMEDGKILFCSASRKSEWILPKGGWEKDEAMEESAIRETFEEAGVFGIIGPTLREIEFETRKGKKRRIEFEEVQRKAKQIREAQSPSPKAVSQTEEGTILPIATFSKNRVASSSADASRQVENEAANRIQGQGQSKIIQHYSDGDTASVASESSTSHSHVKMTLFPLYVTEVRKEWPEQGRFRKVVDIDEAIRITESRPYFQTALKELKQRNLHLTHELNTTSGSGKEER